MTTAAVIWLIVVAAWLTAIAFFAADNHAAHRRSAPSKPEEDQ